MVEGPRKVTTNTDTREITDNHQIYTLTNFLQSPE
jgi:hypothetical protein